MNIFQKIGEWFMSILKTNVQKEFNVDLVKSDIMEIRQNEWNDIIQNHPYWLKEDVKTINFAKFICYFTSKKVCMDLKVNISGSQRADYINKCIKEMVDKSIRDKVEDACGLGGIILKPSGTYNQSAAVDFIMPGYFVVTEKNTNGDILGAIFFDQITKGDNVFTRLEYQHFIDGAEGERYYAIENKAYKSKGKDILGKKIELDEVEEWKNIEEMKVISNVEKPLFGYFKMPFNNTIDYSSPEGVSIFFNAIQELKDLDIAWSRKGDETEDSKHITFLDESAMTKVDKTNGIRRKIDLPRYVKGLRRGIDEKNSIEEHVATMLTEQRIKDINSILAMISTKCGFSQGQFVLDEKTGMITATQVESDQSETVETINDIRNRLKAAINDLVYALNKYCDVFFDMPDGYVNVLDEAVPDEDVYYFKDLMASFEQDRSRAYQLMVQGVYSKKKYLMEYEGFTEKEALEMLEEAKTEREAREPGLFDEE